MNKESNKLLWWGYQHTNGNYQAKRYWDERDIEDALDSPFCAIIIPPFEATGREDALEKIIEQVAQRKF